MKRSVVNILLFSALFLTCGCTGSRREGKEVKETAAASEEPANLPEHIEMSVYPFEDKPKDYDSMSVFTADQDSAAADVLLTANTAVSDLKFLRIRYYASGTRTGYRIYETDKVNEDMPLLVHMTFYGDLPSYGISYTDLDGSARCFEIVQSGKDGSLILNEADDLEVFRYESEEMYREILNGAVMCASGMPEEMKEGAAGIYEVTNRLSDDSGLSRIGYTFMDLNQDGTDELLLAETYSDNIYAGSRILSIFTCRDNIPSAAADGSFRNMYFILNDGSTIYNEGSAGAAYTIFGTGYLLPDASGIAAADYYFSHEKDPGDPSDIRYYHNETGEFDISVSEELDISASDFFLMMGAYEEQIMVLSLNPLSEYNPS
ncbi:MAG: hypothetical protein K6D03_12200 [Solobacterium sp.]|nr:hypothetical protein [Solobacterium sp.]